MVSKEVIVNNGTGLHARPATLLVKKASSFKSDVSIEFNGKKANVKSLIGVTASGDDETLAAEEIAKLIETLED